jgi:putative SOS response-associated peptidase YedK
MFPVAQKSTLFYVFWIFLGPRQNKRIFKLKNSLNAYILTFFPKWKFSVMVCIEMCGRFTLKSPGRIKFDRADRSSLPPLVPRYNIAPSQNVLSIVQRGIEREAVLIQWGLIPSWSKEAKEFINARSETLDEKPSFNESFQKRRCLIPADGFFEWDQKSGRLKQPYYFQMKDETPFAFAGIWDEWRGTENPITSCAIITTTANELLAPIHKRMPVILPSESYDTWLNGDSEPQKLRNLLTPFPASEMMSHAVGYGVNHPKNDDEHLLRSVEPNLGVTPSLF